MIYWLNAVYVHRAGLMLAEYERLIDWLIDWCVCLCLGIVLAAERRNTNKLLDEVYHSEKIYKLNEVRLNN